VFKTAIRVKQCIAYDKIMIENKIKRENMEIEEIFA